MTIFRKLFEIVKNNQFWSNVVTLSSGQIISLIVNLFSILMVGRVYSQEAFGDYTIISSTGIIIIGFISLGLGSTIMVSEDDEESIKLFNIVFSIQVFLTVILIAFLVIVSPLFQVFQTQLPYSIGILIMFAFIVLSVFSSLMTIYINRLKMYRVLFTNSLIGAFVTVGIKIPLGYLGFDSYGLLISSLIGLIMINWHMLKYTNPLNISLSLKDILTVLKKYKVFLTYQYPSNLLGTFTIQMPNQVVSNYFGNVALGTYSMTNTILGTPISLIALPIQTVYFRNIAEKYRENENIANFTFSLVTKMMLILLIPMILGMAFGEEFFSIILGEKWVNSGKIASLLALQYVFSFCYSCIAYCRVVINKQKINLYTSIFQFVIIVLSLLIGVICFNTFIEVIICFSIANLIYNILNIAITFYCLKQYTFKFITFSLMYCIFSVFIVNLINHIK